MAAPEHVIEKRKSSVLFKQAELGLAARMMLGLEGRASLAISKKLLGGNWVTGNVYLTPDSLEFRPDFLDAKLHKNGEELRLTVPLEKITSMQVRQGIATQILDVTAEEVTVSFRCYRANAFVSAIETARAASQT
ncbi:MAG: hypothetical protein MRY64_14085 [Hyphomonadaceae bacterium]|nr:hypothetical protein [Hyphomonadaceae bacterium]